MVFPDLRPATDSSATGVASAESSLRSEPQGRRQPNGRGYYPLDIRNTEYEIQFTFRFTFRFKGKKP
ncbi:MAG: hypothetical protein A2V67_12770 [Deltaproteobacteria bacterium RBG_13_61_14]|nr:MAG: hypothetical protein A2V67_12770 [Deltaproteobacteria bacterium RBG_13_61_14]